MPVLHKVYQLKLKPIFSLPWCDYDIFIINYYMEFLKRGLFHLMQIRAYLTNLILS